MLYIHRIVVSCFFIKITFQFNIFLKREPRSCSKAVWAPKGNSGEDYLSCRKNLILRCPRMRATTTREIRIADDQKNNPLVISNITSFEKRISFTKAVNRLISAQNITPISIKSRIEGLLILIQHILLNNLSKSASAIPDAFRPAE